MFRASTPPHRPLLSTTTSPRTSGRVPVIRYGIPDRIRDVVDCRVTPHIEKYYCSNPGVSDESTRGRMVYDKAEQIMCNSFARLHLTVPMSDEQVKAVAAAAAAVVLPPRGERVESLREMVTRHFQSVAISGQMLDPDFVHEVLDSAARRLQTFLWVAGGADGLFYDVPVIMPLYTNEAFEVLFMDMANHAHKLLMNRSESTRFWALPVPGATLRIQVTKVYGAVALLMTVDRGTDDADELPMTKQLLKDTPEDLHEEISDDSTISEFLKRSARGDLNGGGSYVSQW